MEVTVMLPVVILYIPEIHQVKLPVVIFYFALYIIIMHHVASNITL